MKIRLCVAVLCVLIGSSLPGGAGELPPMTVWKSPWCGCCAAWAQHMTDAGFEVELKEVEDLASVKKNAGVPEQLQSCHTATVGGYTVEGHVPASDVKRLLAARPEVKGLAVPGMPSGSPGMENGQHDAYNVLTFNGDGEVGVFSRHD
jgi:hypothetical protein